MSEFENPKIKIAQYVGVLGSGGIETFALNLFDHLDKSRFSVDFIVDSPKETRWDSHIISEGGIKVSISQLDHKKARVYKKIYKIFKLFSIFKNNSYKVAHIHISYPSTLFYCLLAKKAGIPKVIAHSHSSSYGKATTLLKIESAISRALFLKSCDLVFADSEKAGSFMFGNYKAEVVRMGIDANKYIFDAQKREIIRKGLGIDLNTHVIGHVGRFAYAKNHSFLIDIFNEYLILHSDSILLLVGEGDLENDIKQKVEKFRIENNVIFCGFTNKVNDLMQAMDVFVLPSLSEGLGIVAIEAQASGLPAVLSAAVPKEAILLKSSYVVDIYATKSEWALCIKKAIMENTRDASSVIHVKKAGYDIQSVTNHLQEIFAL